MTIVSGPPGADSTIQPAGHSPLGRLIFTEDNYMSAMVTTPDTDIQKTHSRWNVGTNEEVLRVARPMVTYCGWFQIAKHEDDFHLSTMLAIFLDPTWIGGLQTRKVKLEETNGRKLLTLRPVQHFELPNGVEATAALVWEKLPLDHES